MRSNTEPRAKPSCLLKVAEKPTIGIPLDVGGCEGPATENVRSEMMTGSK